MKILVLGNGNNDHVIDTSYDRVFAANSSFVRIQDPSLTTILILSESLLWDKEKLKILPKVYSKRREDSESSLDIRLSKTKAIRNAHIEELILLKIDNVEESQIRKRLDDLGIIASKLTLLSHKDRFLLMVKTLDFFKILIELA